MNKSVFSSMEHTDFSLSKKSSESWAFSFECGKIGIGGESGRVKNFSHFSSQTLL